MKSKAGKNQSKIDLLMMKKMPPSPQPMMAEEEDMGEEETEEYADAESEMPEETPAAEPSELDSVPDEELLAEIKKRGLMSQLEEGESDEAETV